MLYENLVIVSGSVGISPLATQVNELDFRSGQRQQCRKHVVVIAHQNDRVGYRVPDYSQGVCRKQMYRPFSVVPEMRCRATERYTRVPGMRLGTMSEWQEECSHQYFWQLVGSVNLGGKCDTRGSLMELRMRTDEFQAGWSDTSTRCL